MAFIAVLSLLTWGALLFCHGRFWAGGPWLPKGQVPGAPYPAVAVIIPARDEAASVTACLTSLLEQNYPGPFHIILVDDESTDGTGDIARALPDPQKRLHVIDGAPHPEGWSGKLWAVCQGQKEALRLTGPADYIFLTDADIVHAGDHLSSLMVKAQQDHLDMVSEMVRLNCVTFWEKAIVPAFVYFFALLYPFRKVADPHSSIAGAAGGTILLRRAILEKIGGIEALQGALIDDCTLGAYVKRAGGRLYLGCSEQAWSIRTYQRAGELWHMVARNAYVQLRYNPVLLVVALLAIAMIWLLPLGLLLFGSGRARWAGGMAYGLCCFSFTPTIRWFNLPLWRVLPLPFIAMFYMLATIGSAMNHYYGHGVEWRGRSYTQNDMQDDTAREVPG